MTVATLDNKASYTGNNSQAVFGYGFKIFEASHLKVYVGPNLRDINTHYTITGVGDVAGGNVIFAAGNIPAAGTTVTLLRTLPLKQETDLVLYGAFSAEEIENEFDKVVMVLQQLAESEQRGIRFGPTVNESNNEINLTALVRAGKLLGFDSVGDFTVLTEIGDYRDDWVTSTAYYVRDLVKDASSNNIYICRVGHESGTLATDIAANNWDLILDAAGPALSASTAVAAKNIAVTSKDTTVAAETVVVASKAAVLAAEIVVLAAKIVTENAKDAAVAAKVATEAIVTGLENHDEINVDSVGRVNIPNQTQFTAVSGLSHGNGVAGIQKHSVVDINIGNCYDSTTGKFTAPVDGIYDCSFSGLSKTGLTIVLSLMVIPVGGSASERIVQEHSAISGGYSSVSASFPIQIEQGDEVYIYSDNATFGGKYDTFTMKLST